MPDHWPTEAGWYWVRTKFQHWSRWRVVEVQEQDGKLLHPFLPRPHLKTEWRGPIPEPATDTALFSQEAKAHA